MFLQRRIDAKRHGEMFAANEDKSEQDEKRSANTKNSIVVLAEKSAERRGPESYWKKDRKNSQKKYKSHQEHLVAFPKNRSEIRRQQHGDAAGREKRRHSGDESCDY